MMLPTPAPRIPPAINPCSRSSPPWESSEPCWLSSFASANSVHTATASKPSPPASRCLAKKGRGLLVPAFLLLQPAYGVSVQACRLLLYSRCIAYFFGPTWMVGAAKNALGPTNLKYWHSSAISWPFRSRFPVLFHQASPSGSVIASMSSCDRTSAVESETCPFGVPGGTWHPGTFWKGSTE